MKLCTDCAYRRRVYTFQNGRDAYCLHPRSIDHRDGVSMLCYRARDPGQPCGPAGDLHSSNESRMGYVPVSTWRHTH